jgi:ribosomal protein L37E
MGRIRLDTLSDYLKHGYDIEVLCRACGHKSILTPEALLARGVMRVTEALERRFRCGRCGARSAVMNSTMSGPSGGVRRGETWRDKLGR